MRSSASATHCLTITRDGGVEAKPLTPSGNRFGQCGDGRSEKKASLDARRVANIADCVAVAAGGGKDAGHSVAATADGAVYAWGCDRWQQLGLGSAEAGAVGYTWEGGRLWRTSPQRVGALGDVVDVAAGADHSVALSRDGRVFAWGRGNDGQLGNKAFVGPPRKVAALSKDATRRPVAVAAAAACSCAWLEDALGSGTAACVGSCSKVAESLREALATKVDARKTCRFGEFAEMLT